MCKSIPTKLLRLSSAPLVFYSSVCPAWIPARLALAHVNHIVSPLPEEILPLMESTFSPEVVLRFEDKVDLFMLPKLSHQVRFCFCKNNKRTIIIVLPNSQACLCSAASQRMLSCAMMSEYALGNSQLHLPTDIQSLFGVKHPHGAVHPSRGRESDTLTTNLCPFHLFCCLLLLSLSTCRTAKRPAAWQARLPAWSLGRMALGSS